MSYTVFVIAPIVGKRLPGPAKILDSKFYLNRDEAQTTCDTYNNEMGGGYFDVFPASIMIIDPSYYYSTEKSSKEFKAAMKRGTPVKIDGSGETL